MSRNRNFFYGLGCRGYKKGRLFFLIWTTDCKRRKPFFRKHVEAMSNDLSTRTFPFKYTGLKDLLKVMKFFLDNEQVL
jgi:hypothetical protein